MSGVRAVWAWVGGLLIALALSGCGGGSHHPDPGAKVVYRSVPRPHAIHHNHPGLAQLQRQLARLLRQAGPGTGASVYDLSTGTPLYALRPEVQRPPASVEKLYTSVAALALFGPQARLHTRVFGAGHLDHDGTWAGDLYLRGDGDPTFADGGFRRVWFGGRGASIEDLAGQLAGAGVRRVSGQLIGDASLFDADRGGPSTGMAADIPDFGGQLSALVFDHGATQGALSPGAFAARQLAMTLGRIGVHATAAPGTARTPHHAQLLAEVSSPPIATLLQLMNVPSDDLFAELLTKRMGVHCCGHGTIAAGAHAIRTVIANFNLHPHIVDGSGLSRRDRSSPAEIVALLRDVWHTPDGNTLLASLPVIGQTGTVTTIADRTAAAGRCVAKTGTLDGVTNLAGVCYAQPGHRVAFALFIDGPSNAAALPLLGRMVTAIARYP